MQVDNISIKDIDKRLLDAEYVSNDEISTTLYLALFLQKPKVAFFERNGSVLPQFVELFLVETEFFGAIAAS